MLLKIGIKVNEKSFEIEEFSKPAKMMRELEDFCWEVVEDEPDLFDLKQAFRKTANSWA